MLGRDRTASVHNMLTQARKIVGDCRDAEFR
jgi:hypothetical protein